MTVAMAVIAAPALSANHPLRLVCIVLAVLLLFAVLGAAGEWQEELPQLIGSETW